MTRKKFYEIVARFLTDFGQKLAKVSCPVAVEANLVRFAIWLTKEFSSF
jgi:hypothetical protein